MKFVADLHLHSKYSRAVSAQMTLENIERWARFKGIDVVATGDFTHPFWFDKLQNELEETGNGLFRLKSTTDRKQLTTDNSQLTGTNKSDVSGQLLDVYFLLSCEISSIYTQGGKVRRIHNLFFFPKLASCEKFNLELIKKGANLRSDGRPIVGLSARDLVEIALETDEKALIIPAHAWTPWFSVFGAFSGFDSLSDCFGDMEKNIYAIETGLSSDPVMNWRIKELENRSILSFSDAHSLEKMGREATVFEAEEISYDSIYDAIARDPVSQHAGPVRDFPPTNARSTEESDRVKRQSDISETQTLRVSGSPPIRATRGKFAATPRSRIAFTIEFYPEEGKYHFTGHRDCGVCLSPAQTVQKGEICSVCGKTLTIGVMHRVEELATQNPGFKIQNSNGFRWVLSKEILRPPFVSCVPLMEIIAEAVGSLPATKKVQEIYFALVTNIGSEFNVLLKEDLKTVAKIAGLKIAEGIGKVRNGDIIVEPGYDGKFGIVKIFLKDAAISGTNSDNQKESQLTLFAQ